MVLVLNKTDIIEKKVPLIISLSLSLSKQQKNNIIIILIKNPND